MLISINKKFKKIENRSKKSFYIPEKLKINNDDYVCNTNLKQLDEIPQGGFGIVIFYKKICISKDNDDNNNSIAVKFLNLSALREKGGNRKVKKAEFEIKILEMIKKKLNERCKKRLINYIGNYKFSKNNNDYLMIIIEKMDFDLKKFIQLEKSRNMEKIDLKIVKNIFYNVVIGLQCLHNMKIVYNDLKLENILINNNYDDEQRNVKIIDFNCIFRVDKISKVATGCSTRSYRSPEQIKEGKMNDFRIDSWQLGLILICLLTMNPNSFIRSLKELDEYKDVEINRLILDLKKKDLKREISKIKKLYKLNKYELINLKKLIYGLLRKDLSERYTINDILMNKFLFDDKIND